MSGWKKSLEQAKLMEEEAKNFLGKELEEIDKPPSIEQTLQVNKILGKALIEALDINGIEKTVLNGLRLATFNLASLEEFSYSSVNSSDREAHRDMIYNITDKALESARKLMNEVEEGKDDE